MELTVNDIFSSSQKITNIHTLLDKLNIWFNLLSTGIQSVDRFCNVSVL